MKIQDSLARLAAAAAGLLLSGACLAYADDSRSPASATSEAPAAAADHSADWDRVLQLGRIQVQGDTDETSRRIVAGLKVIKLALKTKLSNDPADADKVVCRMNYDTGSHLTAHLMCATNRTMMVYKDRLHTEQLVHQYGIPDGGEEQVLENLNGSVGRDRYFSTKVNAAELQKLLLQVKCKDCSDSGLVVGNN